MKRLLIICFLSFLLLLTVGVLGYYYFHTNISYTPTPQKESSQFLSNPYCGFYQIHGFQLKDHGLSDTADMASHFVSDYPLPLALIEINLIHYKNTELSSDALEELDTILSHYANANITMILRFVYDWDGNGLQSEPSHISTIKQHMEQVSDIVNSYKSHILLHQGIFTGDFGEMHHTHYGTDETITELMSHLASQLDPAIFLAVRTPAHRRTIVKDFSTLDSHTAYTSSLPSRLGLFNDGMMGNALDCGTYGDTSMDFHGAYSQKGTREEELAYQNSLCQYVPNGGEAVLDNSYNDLPQAIESLRTMHVSYLNELHDSAVVEKWKQTPYEGDELFQNITGFEYIKRHLGYRFFLDSSSLDEKKITLKIANRGFAPCYRKLDVKLVLIQHSTNAETCISVDNDTRTWLSQTTQSVTIPLPSSSLQKGIYDVYFQVTDPSTGCPITFANESSQPDSRIPLGTLNIS